MELAGTGVPLLTAAGKNFAKTLPGGQKKYEEINAHADKLVPDGVNFDLISPKKAEEAMKVFNDMETADSKSFAQTVLGPDQV